MFRGQGGGVTEGAKAAVGPEPSQMDAEQIERKLAQIAKLTPSELEGWWLFKKLGIVKRPFFPGEVEALRDRARVLGVDLSKCVLL